MGDYMKIGIPRGLFYYHFKDLWLNFFDYLNIQVVVSPETNKEILNLGLKYSSDEMCLSMKTYIGHVAYLKDKCSHILIPRIDNYGLDNQTCTNFLATFDIINNLFDINILNYNINLRNRETELDGLISIGKSLGINKKVIKEAYEYAKVKEIKEKKNNIYSNLKRLRVDKKKILLVGHPYNIYDKLIGEPIINMLESLNIEVIYSDSFNTNNEFKEYTEGLYWKYSKENISSIVKCMDKVDGIIFISSFPCGLDSLTNELVMRKLNKPYINLIIDDVESSGGIETRIESFVDIISGSVL